MKIAAVLTIDIAETTGLRLLRVMKPASPVDRDVALLAIQASGTLHAAASADTTKLEETIKDRTVVAHVVLALLAHVVVHVIRGHLLKEVDVVVGMKLCHFAPSRWFRALLTVRQSYLCLGLEGAHIDLHLLEQVVLHDQAVRQADSMRLHWMSSGVSIVSNVGVVEVCDLLGG